MLATRLSYGFNHTNSFFPRTRPLNFDQEGLERMTFAERTAQNVRYLGLGILSVIVFTASLTFNVCTLFIPCAINAYHVHHIREMVKNRKRKVLASVLDATITPDGKNVAEYFRSHPRFEGRKLSFARDVCEVWADVLERDDPDKIRSKVNEILTNYPEFRDTNDKQVGPLVNFLQILSIKLFGGACDSIRMVRESSFKAYGRELIGDHCKEGFRELSYQLDKNVEKPIGFRRDGIISSLFWVLVNPLTTIKSIQDNIDPRFNLSNGNPTCCGSLYEIGNRRVICVLGPSPAYEPIYQLYLDALKKRNLFELRVNLQKHGLSSEGRRTETLVGMSNAQQALHLISTPANLSATMVRDVRPYLNARLDIDRFFDEVIVPRYTTSEHFSGEIDVYIRGDVLSEQKVGEALKESRELFKKLSKTDFWKKLEREGVSGRFRLIDLSFGLNFLCMI